MFLSPPWGGINYTRASLFDIHTMGNTASNDTGSDDSEQGIGNLVGSSELDARVLIKISRMTSENVAIYLPKNSDLKKVFLNPLSGSDFNSQGT